ncbi:hypothetical protein B0H11DRAFT_1923932 [Mycena galericulata]|nr:hypothetical protein B0H11DRAFT_1923932 [Mycena galericulata]
MNASSSSSRWLPPPGSSSDSSDTFRTSTSTNSWSPEFSLQLPATPTPLPARSTYNSQRLPQMNMMNPMFSNSLNTANHNDLVTSGNPTYAKLLTMYSGLKIEHVTLRSDEESSLPLSSINRTHQLSKEDYPLVVLWDHADFTNADSDLTTISEDDESAKLTFLEHQNGDRFTAQEEADTRAHIRAAFVSLLEKQLAPLTWSQASSIAVNWLRTEMLSYCPDLGLCAMNWKVDALATEVYSQWSRHRRDVVKSHRPAPANTNTNTNTNGKRRSAESESSIASKKHKSESSVSKVSTETASRKTTKKPTRKPSPTPAPNTAPVAVTSASDTTSPANSSPMVSSSSVSVIVSVSTAPATSPSHE